MGTVSVASSQLGASPGKPLRAGLWLAQLLVCGLFILFGSMKLLMPVSQLGEMWIWPAQVPTWFLHMTGILDIAGGLGVLLPALTRIQPRLTVWAALGCTLLQIAAMIFHISRGEMAALPLNVILLGLAVFVLWGRGKKAPIAPRE